MTFDKIQYGGLQVSVTKSTAYTASCRIHSGPMLQESMKLDFSLEFDIVIVRAVCYRLVVF